MQEFNIFIIFVPPVGFAGPSMFAKSKAFSLAERRHVSFSPDAKLFGIEGMCTALMGIEVF